MPFDAELPIRASHTLRHSTTFEVAADPTPELAESDPAILLVFLYGSPRPCAALAALLGV